MIYKIKLSNREAFVLIDDVVYEWLSNDLHFQEIGLLDHLRMHSSGCVVFQKVWRRNDGSYRTETIYLHRLIAERFLASQKTREKPLVSSVNGDKLDCRLENLTFRARSTASRLRKTYNLTGYTGVYPERNRFRAIISINGQQVHLGMFDTPEEAAAAYNRASREHLGEEGKINNIATKRKG